MSGNRTHRRTFLKTAAAVTGGAALAPAIVPARLLGQDAPSEKITVAFIGTGNNGTNWLAPFLGDSRVRVVSVCGGPTGICVVPLTGFCCDRQGFRITLLETDDEKRLWTWHTIAKSIEDYLSSA